MYKKSNISKRIAASLVDIIISWLPALILPILGGILGFAYILTRDTVVYQFQNQKEWQNRSIGKKIFELKVKKLNGQETVDYLTSIKRNLPLVLGGIMGILPVVGWILGTLLGLIVIIIEIILIIFDDNGQRLGDRLAKTQVIDFKESRKKESKNVYRFRR